MASSLRNLSRTQIAVIGFVLTLAPLSFVGASILGYEMGIGVFVRLIDVFSGTPERLRVFNIVSPVLFLGGLLLACAMNATPLIRVRVKREGKAFVASVKVERDMKNMAVIALSAMLLATLFGYFIMENFVPR